MLERLPGVVASDRAAARDAAMLSGVGKPEQGVEGDRHAPGMNTLALHVQEGIGRDPHGGDLFVFRGRRGELLKILWHDGVGVSLYTKRLERGRFPWPSTVGAAVSVSAAQLAYLLEGID